MRRHGWQLPLHPLQYVGVVVFIFLVLSFYVLLGPYVGNRIAEITILTLFSFSAVSVAVLYITCTAIDPSDKTSAKRQKKSNRKLPKLKYKNILSHVFTRFFWRVENKLFSKFIRRSYLEQWNSNIQLDPLLPFPFAETNDSVSPCKKDNEISFCALCDSEVKLRSKHCKRCNRCVDGFDHHCRWLNNCIGRKNYTVFILLMIFVLLMLIIEGGTALTIFIRCFINYKGIKRETEQRLHFVYPKGVLATVSLLLAIFNGYSTAALGQLFFFHIILIKKGIRTYDYILAMREEANAFGDPFEDPFEDDSDYSSSDESTEFDESERQHCLSRFCCDKNEVDQSTRRLSIKVEKEPTNNNKPNTNYDINPWKLIKISKEKALKAAERARERMGLLKPLPNETKQGLKNTEITISPQTITKSRFSSPRRRFSGSPSPKPQKYRANFDLKLVVVSKEMESHISKQVLCSVLANEGASPA
ncbi:hypothetical protein LUZ60_015792 [Juncus effusus]|nr:hypothetical protein LUZ60_015792 [Juncus effusus]